MSKLEKVTVVLVVALLTTFLTVSGCQDSLMPCYVSEEAQAFAGADIPLLAPYTTIVDAKYTEARMDYVNAAGQLKYGYLKGDLTVHLARAEAIKAVVFDPESPLVLGLMVLMGGAGGALAISKPSDKKKITELENGKAK